MTNGIPQAVHLLKQENMRLTEQIEVLEAENKALQSYIKGISALYDATLNIAHHDNLYHLLDEILYQALVVLNTDNGSILLVDEEAKELVFVLVHGDLRDSLDEYRMDWHQGIAGSVVKHGKPLIVNQTQFDPRFSNEIDRVFGITSNNILAVPMVSGDKIIGVIELVNKRNGEKFTESDAALLALLALFAATSLDQLNRQLEIDEETV